MNVQDMLQTLDSYFRNNQVDQVEPFLLDHLNQAFASHDYGAALTVLNELMGFYRGMSRFSEAVAVAQRALGLLESLGYKGSVPYATTLLNAATAYRADGQTARAITAYEEVMAIYTANHAAPYQMASLFNNMSLAYQEQGDHAQATTCLERALPLVQSVAGSEAEVAVTHTNLAVSRIKGGQFDAARADLLRAVELFESQADRNPHYGAALSALGEVAFRQGDAAQAVDYYQRALSAIEAHYGKNMYYAVTLESLAVVLEDTDAARSQTLMAEAQGIQSALRG
ncbi:MAG: tetratricopeptide repeat protein [Rhodocyclaceae bacterium]